MMKKKQMIIVALATLLAWPMSMGAGNYGFYPVDDDDLDDDDDEIPILVHGPHRSPQNKPLASAEFNVGSGTVEITFNKSLANVNVQIWKNGMMMNWYIGNAVAGTEYMIPVGNDGSNTGMVLYVVSQGKVFSVINLD